MKPILFAISIALVTTVAPIAEFAVESGASPGEPQRIAQVTPTPTPTPTARPTPTVRPTPIPSRAPDPLDPSSPDATKNSPTGRGSTERGTTGNPGTGPGLNPAEGESTNRGTGAGTGGAGSGGGSK